MHAPTRETAERIEYLESRVEYLEQTLAILLRYLLHHVGEKKAEPRRKKDVATFAGIDELLRRELERIAPDLVERVELPYTMRDALANRDY